MNKTFGVKEEIQPLQNAMVDAIKADIGGFEQVLGVCQEVPRRRQPDRVRRRVWGDRNGVRRARRLREAAHRHRAEARQFGDLQELFELVSRHLDPEMRAELLMLKKVWDTVAMCKSFFSQWG